MKSIRSLPCEIIGLILANCESFAELLDAILTCRSFYSAWKSHTGSILWHIGQLEIIGFRDALIAVRALLILRADTSVNLSSLTNDERLGESDRDCKTSDLQGRSPSLSIPSRRTERAGPQTNTGRAKGSVRFPAFGRVP
jgi:hypothetical protein